MADNDMDRVVPLGRLNDYKVAEGDPDVRGWEVMASDGRKIGEVEELLVDTTAMKVRYLEVDVDNTLMADTAGAGDRHVLIPIGYARLERERDSITVDALSSADLHTIPAYDRTSGVTREHETAVRDHFNRPSQARTTSSTDAVAAGGLSTGGQVGLGSGVEAGTAGALDTGGGIDTAGLNHTPGTTTGMHASGTPIGGTGMSDSAAGIRGAGSDFSGTGGMPAGSTGGMGTTGGM
ncbi:MAG TPA: PRC-barrel domain-containing protein, partial [Longimicrobium sp.]|nr:PRC-barrel domain-containing protein [Longimicrobium sp.]